MNVREWFKGRKRTVIAFGIGYFTLLGMLIIAEGQYREKLPVSEKIQIYDYDNVMLKGSDVVEILYYIPEMDVSAVSIGSSYYVKNDVDYQEFIGRNSIKYIAPSSKWHCAINSGDDTEMVICFTPIDGQE
ncbi:hypothetical protein bpr_II337 (plasmid) [Butyrivibrio proteoclasticus B316]|uniref:Uncharacterized protein n=1 Tax=Butyrivibrio proteoclasticus (strain ATCC 51982 / DSM 14932 / B316) TaxID=515622 RepID=E0S4E2_BUTPB|nr:hypothetical protein [Butyrivibrio proteoclasticus]ADL36274.1 hypothetical protein bpr_II337 [Butyrivibrio proteoclasticus B316]